MPPVAAPFALASTPSRRRLRSSPAVHAAALALVVGVLSFLPPDVKAILHTRGQLHTWYHLAAFGAIAFYFLRAAKSPAQRFAVFFGALALGCGVELTQAVVNHYYLERLDIVSDSIGVLLGGIVNLCLPLLQVRRPLPYASPSSRS